MSLPEYFRLPDRFVSVGNCQGRRLMAPCTRWHHPGVSPPESLRGSPGDDLTLGITRDGLHRREGFTDLSRCSWRDHSRPGQFHLPDKEFRSILLPMVLWETPWGPVISAGLCMSPCSSDFIFNLRQCVTQVVWRKVSEDSASTFDAAFPADCLHSRRCDSPLRE